jgi:hypothetical protein
MVSDKLIKKILVGQTFQENTFEYTFENIQLSENEFAYDVSVHVNLPNPNQSWRRMRRRGKRWLRKKHPERKERRRSHRMRKWCSLRK